MSNVVTLEGFTPGARYDGIAWEKARIEEATTADGPWVVLETQILEPDVDPTKPATRNLTTALASFETGWFRVVWIDAAGAEQTAGAIYSMPETFASSGETVGQLVTDVATNFGFDADESDVLGWFQERHRRMISESGWLRQTLQLAVTVAGGAYYVLPEDVVELHELTVGGYGYTRARRPDMIAGRLARLTLSGIGGVFIPDADEGGVSGVTIYPTPSAAGVPLVGFASMLPPDLAMVERPMVPRDYFGALKDGMIATGLSYDTEQIGAADRFEARFETGVEKLRRLAKRRFRGPGPAQIRVVGINA